LTSFAYGPLKIAVINQHRRISLTVTQELVKIFVHLTRKKFKLNIFKQATLCQPGCQAGVTVTVILVSTFVKMRERTTTNVYADMATS